MLLHIRLSADSSVNMSEIVFPAMPNIHWLIRMDLVSRISWVYGPGEYAGLGRRAHSLEKLQVQSHMEIDVKVE